MENKMTPMSTDHGDLPMEETLCVFKVNSPKEIYLLGSLYFKKTEGKFYVKEYGRNNRILASHFSHFNQVANEEGGFYFVKRKLLNHEKLL